MAVGFVAVLDWVLVVAPHWSVGGAWGLAKKSVALWRALPDWERVGVGYRGVTVEVVLRGVRWEEGL